MNAQSVEVWLFVVTYRRERLLAETLDSIKRSSIELAGLLVIDNGADASVEELCGEHNAVYVSMPYNSGPAGGTAMAMARFLEEASRNAWLIRVDDDRPLSDNEHLEKLVHFASRVRTNDGTVGAVGYAGAVMDLRRWRLEQISWSTREAETGLRYGYADYLATGFFPCWSYDSIEQTGLMDAALFFGMTEVEFGLRMRQRGFRLVVLEDVARPDQVDKKGRPRFLLPSNPDWRYYYRIRNNIVLCRRHSGMRVAVRITVFRYLPKLIASFIVRPRTGAAHVRMFARGVTDAWRNRLGRRLDPWDWHMAHGAFSNDQLPPT